MINIYGEIITTSESFYNQLFDTLPDPVYAIDKEGRVILWNGAMEKLTGVPKEDILGKGDYEYSQIFYGERRPTLIDLVLSPDAIVEQKYENFKRNTDMSVEGEANVLMLDYYDWGKASPIYGENGEIMGAISVSRSIGDIKRAEIEIEKSHERFKALFYNSPDAIAYLDENHRIVDINPSFTELFGYEKDECIGELLDEIVAKGDEVQKAKEITVKLFEEGVVSVDAIRHKKNGEPVHVSARGVLVKTNDMVSAGYGIYTDISERKKMEKLLEHLSYHDQLTGLYNRRYFENEISILDREEYLPISIAMADVNGLKLVNDSFGHSLGDEMLRKMAGVLKGGCREGDMVSRVGGDEFVLVFPKTPLHETERILDRIKTRALSEKVSYVSLSVSFGLAAKESSDELMHDVLKRAEDDMYKKKLFESPSIRGKTIGLIISALHEKNKREEQHSHRVSQLCECMGAALGMSAEKMQELKTVGLLHDIGKIAIDENILNKPGRLEEWEWNEIKKHPEIGYRILSSANEMSEMAEYVLSHHERWDGKGYPKGLRAQQIPLQARIIAVADTYDAITSERPYRASRSEDEAAMEIIKNSGTQFDPRIVRIFIECVLNKKYEKSYS